MSVLIRDMEMPTAGLYIVSIDNTNGRDKTVATVERMLCIRNIRQTVGAFELIPVPAHGRLIDADAFIKDECNNCDGACEALPCDCLNCEADCRCDFMKNLADAPTIIPAEEDE